MGIKTKEVISPFVLCIINILYVHIDGSDMDQAEGDMRVDSSMIRILDGKSGHSAHAHRNIFDM